MINFLKETVEDIKCSGHTPEDIDYIGDREGKYSCSWETFKTIADFEYDDGFGVSGIAVDLIIVFKDGATMWRGEYDGSEWWAYSVPFKKPSKTKPLTSVICKHLWDTVEEIHANNQDSRHRE